MNQTQYLEVINWKFLFIAYLFNSISFYTLLKLPLYSNL
jgi:hypothetical protein